MIDPTTKAGARVLGRLGREIIVWLTTVTPAGQPQPSPVWFLHDGSELLVYSRADTPRLANLRANPRVAATFDGNGDGGEIVILEGEARIVRERSRAADAPPAYATKYAAHLARNGWTMDSFLAEYPVELRITITRLRGW